MDGSLPRGSHHRSASSWSFDDKPSRRLKDSCDMCSASKVRCDRQKPICGRCERLAYPCFYSPARRVGRPQGRSGQPRNSRRNSATDNGVIPNIVPPTDHLMYPASPLRCRASDQLPFASPQKTPTLPDLLIPPALQQQPETRAQPISDGSPSVSPLEGCESDCVELGMSTQRHLESAYSQLDAATSAGIWTRASMQIAEVALQTAGVALRRLSMALICPCSERLETGIVISAACMSILDLYSTIVNRSNPWLSAASAPATNQNSPLTTQALSSISLPDALGVDLFWDDDLSFSAGSTINKYNNNDNHHNHNRNSNDNTRRGRQKEHHLLLADVLGELAKLATVVYQFTRRYQAGQGQVESAASDILQSVAALLKSRVKAVGGDTAARLQTAPTHRETGGRGHHGFGT